MDSKRKRILEKDAIYLEQARTICGNKQSIKTSYEENRRKQVDEEVIEKVAEKNKNMKAVRRNLGKMTSSCLKLKNQEVTLDQEGIMHLIETGNTKNDEKQQRTGKRRSAHRANEGTGNFRYTNKILLNKFLEQK